MKTKGLVLLLPIFLCFSCDRSTPFVIDGKKEYSLYSQCGTIAVGGSSFSTLVMVTCLFNGKYHINTDSLKIEAFSREDILTINHFQYNNEEFSGKEIETVGGEILYFSCNLQSNAPYRKSTGMILLLPSNFITCEGKPIITDTIKIQLKN